MHFDKSFTSTAIAAALAVAAVATAADADAAITFYERGDFQGRSVTINNRIPDMNSVGFNDETSSVVVTGNRYEVCQDAGFRGDCVVLRPGQYASLNAMGLNNRISSARVIPNNAQVGDDRYAPLPVVAEDFRRGGKQLFEADVVEVRAVVGPPQQRCWMEKQEVAVDNTNRTVGGGLAGAVIGGILGHQIGHGTGRTLATIAGAGAGGAVGANVGRNYGGQQTRTQDVQRCETQQADAKPEYWDVTYTFRGQTHHAQLTAPPGRTILVDRDGVPRA